MSAKGGCWAGLNTDLNCFSRSEQNLWDITFKMDFKEEEENALDGDEPKKFSGNFLTNS